MERRKFLTWGGALASLSTYPWLAGCESAPRSESTAPAQLPDSVVLPSVPAPLELDVDPFAAVGLDLAGTLERARLLGKPVLLFVAIADKYDPQPSHATLFAKFLGDGRDGFWADLALCELACASPAEILAVLPGVQIDGEPFFLLVEHEAAGRRVVVLDVRAPRPLDRTQDEHERRLAVKSDMQEWRAQLHQSLAGDLTMLQRRAETARAALGSEAVARIEAVIRASEPPSDALLAGAAAL
ncbi:MAG: hypothetical protein ABIP42_13395, partial [Planctomycetota bacterium]